MKSRFLIIALVATAPLIASGCGADSQSGATTTDPPASLPSEDLAAASEPGGTSGVDPEVAAPTGDALPPDTSSASVEISLLASPDDAHLLGATETTSSDAAMAPMYSRDRESCEPGLRLDSSAADEFSQDAVTSEIRQGGFTLIQTAVLMGSAAEAQGAMEDVRILIVDLCGGDLLDADTLGFASTSELNERVVTTYAATAGDVFVLVYGEAAPKDFSIEAVVLNAAAAIDARLKAT